MNKYTISTVCRTVQMSKPMLHAISHIGIFHKSLIALSVALSSSSLMAEAQSLTVDYFKNYLTKTRKLQDEQKTFR